MNAKQTRHLVRKWDAQILKQQVKERFSGTRITPANQLARRFEAEANLKNQYRRSQALRASGQIAQAQRNDANSLRLQRPGDGEDLREDQGVRGKTAAAIWVDEVSARISAEIITAERLAQRLQEIRPESEMRRLGGGKA